MYIYDHQVSRHLAKSLAFTLRDFGDMLYLCSVAETIFIDEVTLLRSIPAVGLNGGQCHGG